MLQRHGAAASGEAALDLPFGEFLAWNIEISATLEEEAKRRTGKKYL